MSASRQKKKLSKKDIYPLAVAVLSFLLAVAIMRLLFLRYLPDSQPQRRNVQASQELSSQQEVFEAENEYLPSQGR